MSLVQYPSCVVNLTLTFDESLTLVNYPQPVSVESMAYSVAGSRVPTFAPLILEQDGSNFSFVANRVPITASAKLNGYRQASTFEATFNFRDLPIDPRTVRAAAVELHMGTIAPTDFAAGMRGGQIGGSQRSIIQTRAGAGPNPETLVSVFTVDEWKIINGEKSAVVHMSGRDMRGILISTPIGIAPNASAQLLDQLDLAKPIDDVVQQILRFNPFFERFQIVCNPLEFEGGIIPAPNFPTAVPRHRRGARGTRTSGRGNPPSGSMDSVSFWDLITRFCYLVGVIPYFVGNQLHLRPSRTVYDQTSGPIDPVRNPTPFRNGEVRSVDAQSGESITPLRARKLVYGRDIQTLEFERKFDGFHKPRLVRAVSVDDSSPARGELRTIFGFWPPAQNTTGQRARRTRVAPSAQRAQEEVINVPVPGVTDVARLTEIARSVFEEIGRGELSGSCSTRNIASYGGDNADPDLVRLRPGDGVEFLTDTRSSVGPSPLVAPFNAANSLPFDQQVDNVAAALGDQNLARVIVATARGQVFELQRFFRVQHVKIDWSSSKGFTFAFDFQNYVVARNQMTQATPTQASPVTTTVPSSTGGGATP